MAKPMPREAPVRRVRCVVIRGVMKKVGEKFGSGSAPEAA